MNAGEARFLLDGLSRRSLSIKLEPEHNRMYFTDVHREHTDLTTDSTVYRWKRWHGAATSELPTSWYLKPKTRAAAGTTSCRCSVGSRPCSTSSRQLSCAGASRRVCLEIPRSISRSVTRRKCSRTCSASCSLPWPSISLCGCGQTSVATRLRGLQLAPRQARLCKFLWQNTFPLFPPPPPPPVWLLRVKQSACFSHGEVQINFSYTGRWLGLEPSPTQRSTSMQEDVSLATEEIEDDLSCSSLYRGLACASWLKPAAGTPCRAEDAAAPHDSRWSGWPADMSPSVQASSVLPVTVMSLTNEL